MASSMTDLLDQPSAFCNYCMVTMSVDKGKCRYYLPDFYGAFDLVAHNFPSKVGLFIQ